MENSQDMSPEHKLQLQQNIKLISDSALKIFNLLPPGAALTVKWIKQSALITRAGNQPEVFSLQINKPITTFEIAVKIQ